MRPSPVNEARPVKFFRDAAWLTRERAAAYAWLVIAIMLAAGAVRAPFGLRFASDYRSFYAASSLALTGHPEQAYVPAVHYATEQAVGGDRANGWAAFFYPPVYLLICLPLALLPFVASAIAWIAVTGGAFYASVARLVPRGTWLFALAFPASWLTVGSAQNGFLTAGLIGFGIRWLDPYPVLAGICLAGLVYKPQFAIMFPVVLLATGRWQALAAAAAATAALVGLSIAAFGLQPWVGFFQELPMAREALASGAEKAEKLISVLGSAIMLGIPVDAAFGLQILAGVAASVALGLFARRSPDATALGAAASLAALLASPWLHVYDLPVLALPILRLASTGLRAGFQPWQKSAVFVGYSLPLISPPLTRGLHMPVVPFVLLGLFVLIWRTREQGAAPRLAGSAGRSHWCRSSLR